MVNADLKIEIEEVTEMRKELENQMDEGKRRNNWVMGKLDFLTPKNTPTRSSARAKLVSRIEDTGKPLWVQLFQPKYRTAWASLIILAILTAALTIPQIRAIGNSFLGLFRIEQIEAVDVGISLSTLPQEMEHNFEAIDYLIGDQLSIDKIVQPILVEDISETKSMVGFDARDPTYPQGEKQIYYQEATTVRLVIDQKRWQALIDTMGYGSFTIPKSADGEEVAIHIPAGVVIGIGDCLYNEINEVKLGHPETENCTIFLQSTSPTFEAPPGVDINKAGQLLLQALGMSPAEAEQFSATINWATTLVVPVPSDMNYQQVMVEGVKGIYLEEETYPGEKAVYTLMWLKDDILNALIGDGSLEDALKAVESLN